MTPLFPNAGGIGQIVIQIIVIVAVIAIALIAVQVSGIMIPAWVMQILWICLFVVIAVFAVRFVTGQA